MPLRMEMRMAILRKIQRKRFDIFDFMNYKICPFKING